jgi:TonB family protein
MSLRRALRLLLLAALGLAACSHATPTKFPFAAYFSAIKSQVRAKLATESTCNGRSSFVSVVLTPAGQIVDLGVVESCGVAQADARLLDAFRDAQPFPVAPPQLVQSGVVRFKMSFRHGNGTVDGEDQPR